ncbi:type ISP restriction/modification enzyme [Staphylococcus epidermidis]|uniref:type ISP restriction/modification enzyme n=1 Tax=Staphylococcus epidermidis TaxID=1282 RepID=UPI0002F6C05E|nr:type ISP restriction/modification enzyme [Staphylococcus epidermidis]
MQDKNNDWINQRDENYEKYDSIMETFIQKIIGVSTNRDAWVYGFNKNKTIEKENTMISNYNNIIIQVRESTNHYSKDNRNMNSSEIKWTVNLTKRFEKGEIITLNDENIELSMYRPFTKKWLYYDKNMVERTGKSKGLYKNINKAIYITRVGASKEFSALVVNVVPNLDLMEKGQGFVEYINDNHNKLVSNIDGSKLKKFNLNKEEFVKIGRDLMDLHLHYENIDLNKDVSIKKANNPSYRIEKMRFPKRDKKDTIIVNKDITIENIPLKAYDYKINGKSAIEWIIDQYQVKVDKNTGIIDDPNKYSDDPKFVFNHLLKIINLSIITTDLIKELPSLEIVNDN